MQILLKRCWLAFLAVGLASFQEPVISAEDVVPIGIWALDEADGTAATDSSENGHNGTIVGALRVPGKIEGGLSFNGLSDYVYGPDAQFGGTTTAGLDMGTRDWTVAAWISTTSSGMVVTKMGFVGGSNPDGWGLSISQNGTVGAVLHKSNGGIVNIFSGDGLQSGTRYSLASLKGQNINNSRQLRIGARDQTGDEIWFDGIIDDARVYAAALTPQEIAALAGVEPPPVETDLWSDPLSLVSAHGV